MGNLQKKIHRKIWYIITQLYYRKSFKEIGKNSILFRPVQIDHESTIVIKENVSIYHSAWLMGNDQVEVSMYIGAGTTIGHYAHLVAKKKVCLGENVLVADRVFITDCTHEYQDIHTPISQQPVKSIKDVSIGADSWIGENACIIGASVGRHCVIGANTVVIKDIPDYSIAVGSPAVIVKKYDFDLRQWVSVRTEK